MTDDATKQAESLLFNSFSLVRLNIADITVVGQCLSFSLSLPWEMDEADQRDVYKNNRLALDASNNCKQENKCK